MAVERPCGRDEQEGSDAMSDYLLAHPFISQPWVDRYWHLTSLAKCGNTAQSRIISRNQLQHMAELADECEVLRAEVHKLRPALIRANEDIRELRRLVDLLEGRTKP